MDMSLVFYKIKQLTMKNDIQDASQIMLASSFSLKVTYSKDKQFAIATLTQKLKSEGCDDFYIELAVEGTFQVQDMDSNVQKKDAHVMCYDLLFPFASQIITQLCLNSGISGFVLQKVPLSTENISFGKLPEKSKNDKITVFPDTSIPM